VKVLTSIKYQKCLAIGVLLALLLFFPANPAPGQNMSNVLRFDPTLDYNLIVSSGYIAEKIPSFATIAGALQAQVVIYVNDKVYIDRGARDEIEDGGLYVIYRLDNEVINPGTGALLGTKVSILGFLKVLSVENNRSLATIVTSYDIIYRGDRVGSIRQVLPQWQYTFLPAKERPKKRGLIVETRTPRALQGKYDVVYLNLGRDDGLGPGDRLRIIKPLENFSFDNRESQIEKEIGELEVISSQKKSATAIIKVSLEEITIPAIVESISPREAGK